MVATSETKYKRYELDKHRECCDMLRSDIEKNTDIFYEVDLIHRPIILGNLELTPPFGGTLST